MLVYFVHSAFFCMYKMCLCAFFFWLFLSIFVSLMHNKLSFCGQVKGLIDSPTSNIIIKFSVSIISYIHAVMVARWWPHVTLYKMLPIELHTVMYTSCKYMKRGHCYWSQTLGHYKNILYIHQRLKLISNKNFFNSKLTCSKFYNI